MINRKAVIIGIKGKSLSKKEKILLKNHKPWGVILFSRNIFDFFQLKDLIDEIKYTIQDKYYPILIDEEGGHVSRMNKIVDLSSFSQKYFAELYKNRKEQSEAN